VVLSGCLGLWSCGGDSEVSEEPSPPPETREGPLEPGQTFPDVAVLDLEGAKISTEQLTRGYDSLIFFISVSCDACEELIEAWRERTDQIPEHLVVFAVTEEDVTFARRFAESREFPFPLYCDEEGIFSTRYQVVVFPCVVAVTGEGRIAYVGKAVTPEFTPRKAAGLLKRVKMGKEEN
jgi:peroxiredoxin